MASRSGTGSRPRQVFATLRFDGARALMRQHHARVLPLYQRVFEKRTRWSAEVTSSQPFFTRLRLPPLLG